MGVLQSKSNLPYNQNIRSAEIKEIKNLLFKGDCYMLYFVEAVLINVCPLEWEYKGTR